MINKNILVYIFFFNLILKINSLNITDISQQSPGFRRLNDFYAESTFCEAREYLLLIEDDYLLNDLVISTDTLYSGSISPFVTDNTYKGLYNLKFNFVPIGEGFFNFTITNTNSPDTPTTFNNQIFYSCIEQPYPLILEPMNNGESLMSKNHLSSAIVSYKVLNWNITYGFKIEPTVPASQNLTVYTLAPQTLTYFSENILVFIILLSPPFSYTSNNITISIPHPNGNYTEASFIIPEIIPYDTNTIPDDFNCTLKNSIFSYTIVFCSINIINSTNLIFFTSENDPGSAFPRESKYGTPDSYSMYSLYYYRYNVEMVTETLYFSVITSNLSIPLLPKKEITFTDSPIYIVPNFDVSDTPPLMVFNENTIPSIQNITFIPWIGTKAIVRLHVTDMGSGFSHLTLYSAPLLFSDQIVSGDVNDGVFEEILDYKIFSFAPAVPFGAVDFNGLKSSNYPMDEPRYFANANLEKVATFPAILDAPPVYSSSNFTSFFYRCNHIDMSNGPLWNTLYFNLTNPSKDIVAYIKIRNHFPDIYLAEPSYSTWDEELKLYKIDFLMKGKLFTGLAFSYFLFVGNIILFNTQFELMFPDTARIKVYSDFADEYPPIVSDWKAFPSTNLTMDYLTDEITVGFNITIEDPYNGFSNGSLTIAGNHDPGAIFNFDLSDRIDGDEFSGVYSFSLILKGNYKSDIYGIRDIQLFDKGGWESNTLSYYVDPLSEVSIPLIQVNCPAGDALNDNTPPVLVDIQYQPSNIDVGSIDRSLNITITFQDIAGSGVNIDRVPFLVLNTVDLKHSWKGWFTYLSSNGNNVTFQYFNESLSYGFGYPYGIFLQLGRILDYQYNVLSLNNTFLKDNNYTYNIPVSFSRTPFIKGNEIVYTTQQSGSITIYGNSFTPTEVRTVKLLFNGDSTGYQEYSNITFDSNVALVISGVPTIQSSVLVQITCDGKPSNEYKISTSIRPPSALAQGWCTNIPSSSSSEVTPPPTTSPLNPCDVDKKCSGNGICTSTGCKCNIGWENQYCDSKVIVLPDPKINQTSPSYENDIPIELPNGETIILKTFVSIISIRELNTNDQPINEYKFNNQNQWKYSDISTNSSDLYLYETNFTKDGMMTSVNVTTQWFKEIGYVIFAQQNLTMNPSTMKYNIQVSSYKFTSKLNRLQIIMSASILSASSSSCSNQEFGETSDLYYQYAKLQIDNHSLFGKFIKIGIVDDRVIKINNQLLKDYAPNNSNTSLTETYIGITIPNFNDKIILDPDFSVLIDSRPASESSTSICEIKEDIGLSKTQIAGIVIGCFGFVAVVIISIVYFYYKRRVGKQYENKLKRASMTK